MKYLIYYHLKSDGNGTKVQTPFLGMCAENNKKFLSGSINLGKLVTLIIDNNDDLLVKEPNPIINIAMQNSYKDTAIINLVAEPNEDVEGNIVWNYDLLANIAKIEGNQLVFLAHYVGSVSLTAKADNCKNSHVILVTCDNAIVSTKYSLGLVDQINAVDADVIFANITYTVIPTYIHHDGSFTTGLPINMSNEVKFDVNNTSNEIIRSGSFIDQYNVNVPWSLVQYAADYLTFTALENNSVIQLLNYNSNSPTIYYSIDDGDSYEKWNYSSITLLAGKSVKLYGDNTAGFNFSSSKYSKFIMSGKIAASGNILSLISISCPTKIPNGYCYFSLFSGCSSLISAPKLMATTLLGNCYYNMFLGCTGLSITPALPASTLVWRCYDNMFRDCSNITAVSEFRATTVALYCCQNMFYNCTSLINAPKLPATIVEEGCYHTMFYNCNNLKTAPELPAATLKVKSYIKMFYGCSNINYIKCLAINTFALSCLEDWLYGVSPTGTFVKDSRASFQTGTSGIPSQWTILNV